MITTTLLFPRKMPCLSQQTIYFGTPGLVREGFTSASAYSHCNSEKKLSENYPYAAATHIPTNYAVEQQETINIFNDKISRFTTDKPPGNSFTMQYGCRKSPITYKSDSYKYCGAWSYNACNVPRNM